MYRHRLGAHTQVTHHATVVYDGQRNPRDILILQAI